MSNWFLLGWLLYNVILNVPIFETIYLVLFLFMVFSVAVCSESIVDVKYHQFPSRIFHSTSGRFLIVFLVISTVELRPLAEKYFSCTAKVEMLFSIFDHEHM